MKNIRLLLIMTAFAASCTSCTPDYDYRSTTKEFISNGSWKIDYFFTSEDKTNEFNSYEVRFHADGTLSVVSSNQSHSGSWNVIRDTKGSEVLTINVQEQPNLAELSNRWLVQEKNSNRFLLAAPTTQYQLHIRQL
ncbi:MAG TPA: hypothetical protein VEZ55_15955 [Chitinophagaceae bacterium]|nr:hypothetical protein [Chitinophagaceae bacterium]